MSLADLAQAAYEREREREKRQREEMEEAEVQAREMVVRAAFTYLMHWVQEQAGWILESAPSPKFNIVLDRVISTGLGRMPMEVELTVDGIRLRLVQRMPTDQGDAWTKLETLFQTAPLFDIYARDSIDEWVKVSSLAELGQIAAQPT